MKTRIIIAAIFVPILFVILFFLPPIYLTVFIAVVSGGAAFELMKVSGAVFKKRLYLYSTAASVAIPFGIYLGAGDTVFRAALFLLTAALFTEGIIAFGKERRIQFGEILTVIFAGGIISYFLSVMVSLKMLDNGRFYVLLPVLVTMISDSGAYFAGVYLGKRKAFPHVSPNKTVEGCAGGLLSAIAGLMLYGLILFLCKVPVNFTALLLIAVLGNIATQLGDLSFSLVKRLFGVKDFGKLIPGHGGMLDRFDSLIFAAPVVYMLVLIFPVF